MILWILGGLAVFALLLMTGLLGVIVAFFIWAAIAVVTIVVQAIALTVGAVIWVGWFCFRPKAAMAALKANPAWNRT